MEKVMNDLTTTEKGIKGKGAEEVDPARKEASVTSRKISMTIVKCTTKPILIQNQTTVSFTAPTMTFS
jgi:hypothetical protein